MGRFYILFILFGLTTSVFSQNAKMSREEYIEEYKNLAIKEMRRASVPASITLAQGLLESDNGNSSLAVKGNNHFGIKCHNSWKGKKMYHDDDEKHECFRKYKSVYESYVDHSDFLLNGSRYDFLFELKITDYKGWARGLKKAGYATSNKYSDLLIRIIEENELHQYDRISTRDESSSKDRKLRFKESRDNSLINNRIKFVIVKEGDSFESLREELSLLKNELYKYNELTPDSVLQAGQILYLQPKRNKAESGKDDHILKEGESLYLISQMYGVKLKKLYEKNHWDSGFEPETGTKVLLRKAKKPKYKLKVPKIEVEEESQKFEFEFDN